MMSCCPFQDVGWSNFVTGHFEFMCIKVIWNSHQYVKKLSWSLKMFRTFRILIRLSWNLGEKNRCILFNSLRLRQYIPGLDTNGCPLGNSKFTLLSDNPNICLWLSACQVEKIYQNQIQIDTNVDNPTSDLDVIYDFNQFNHKCFG